MKKKVKIFVKKRKKSYINSILNEDELKNIYLKSKKLSDEKFIIE